MEKNRINYVDIARGLAIILIVIGHALGYSKHCEIVKRIIYSFHVVLFFMLSGYTLKFKKDEKFICYFWKKFKRIVIPYFIWATIFLIPYIIIGPKISSDLDKNNSFELLEALKNILYGNGNNNALKQNTPLWFLPALFSMEIIYYFIIKFVNNKPKYFKAIICIPILLIAYITNRYLTLVLPFGINTALVLGIYLYFGYLAKEIKLFEKEKLFKLPIILLLFIVGIISSISNSTVIPANYTYGYLTLALISGFCLSIFVIYIAYLINKNTVFELLGRKSITILIFHKIILIVFQTKMGIITRVLKNSNIFIELIIGILITSLAIVICLIIDKILEFLSNLYKERRRNIK